LSSRRPDFPQANQEATNNRWLANNGDRRTLLAQDRKNCGAATSAGIGGVSAIDLALLVRQARPNTLVPIYVSSAFTPGRVL